MRLTTHYHHTRYEENGSEGKFSLRMPRRKSSVFKPPVLIQFQVTADTQGNLSIQRRCGLLPTSHGRVSPTLLTLPITSLRTLRASLTLPRPERPERPQVLERFFWCLASGRLSRNLRPRPAARPRLTLRTQRTERTQNLETLDGYLALAATFPESPSASVRVSASLP